MATITLTLRKTGRQKPVPKYWLEQAASLHLFAKLVCESNGHVPPSPLDYPCGKCLEEMIARTLMAATEGKLGKAKA